jgi:hypothetical protein
MRRKVVLDNRCNKLPDTLKPFKLPLKKLLEISQIVKDMDSD